MYVHRYSYIKTCHNIDIILLLKRIKEQGSEGVNEEYTYISSDRAVYVTTKRKEICKYKAFEKQLLKTNIN